MFSCSPGNFLFLDLLLRATSRRSASELTPGDTLLINLLVTSQATTAASSIAGEAGAASPPAAAASPSASAATPSEDDGIEIEGSDDGDFHADPLGTDASEGNYSNSAQLGCPVSISTHDEVTFE